MQASRRRTPNTKCVTPARWGNRGAAYGMENRFHWLALATGPDGKSTGDSSMQINQQKTVQVDVTELRTCMKVRDQVCVTLHDAQGDEVAAYTGYVPDFFPGEHYGDYLMLSIDLETGQIKNWKKPAAADIEKMIEDGDDD